MIHSLRTKLVLSHLVPTVLLLPVLSLFLLFTVEGFYTQNLLQQLSNQARLLRQELERDPGLTADPASAKSFLSSIAPLTDSRVILLGRDATILASSRQEDASRIGTRFEHPSVSQALQGEAAQGVGPGLTAVVAYVVLPLASPVQTAGALRLSYDVDDVREQFLHLRWLIVGGTVLTTVLALALAIGLATTITHPLRALSEGAQKIAAGDFRTRVQLSGQDEVSTLAANFNRMVGRLEEAEHAREQQLAAIVHEIARPLAGMQAAMETVRDVGSSDPAMSDSLLSGVEEELGRLERLIGTLQVLQKRALRAMQLNRSEVSLERVVHASAANFEPIAARAGVMFSIEMPETMPRIRADEDRLIQVLTNLLDNAFKFTPRGGLVRIQAGEDKEQVWVSVSDTGVGISQEELRHLFQQFYRGDESRPPEKRGMGLGLAICRDIITAHRGQIEVKSELGRGTQVRFSIPMEY